MNVTFNGLQETVHPTNLHDLMAVKGLDCKTGIAVAINNTIVPKSSWKTKTLEENDRIVVITATAGG